MNITSTSNISDAYIQSLLNASSTGGSSNSLGSIQPAGAQNDNSQLSPLAQLLSTLQQLQEQNPDQYKQVTGQIAVNLQAAASAAQSSGNSSQAGQLTQLAADFQTASQTGQLPDLQNPATASGAHHHHHHHHSNSKSEVSPSADQDDSSNPLSIIQNTLAASDI